MTKAEQIQARIDSLKAQLAAETARNAKKERAARTRELIQLGALLVADNAQAGLVKKYREQIAAQEKEKATKKVAKKVESPAK